MALEAEELAIILAGISSVIASLVYLTKNIKESSCLGSKCTQDTGQTEIDHIRIAESSFPPDLVSNV